VPDIPASFPRPQRQILLLAPGIADAPPEFCHVVTSPRYYSELLAETQRFRGGVYFEDGAIHGAELAPDGRHLESADLQGWHILTLDDGGSVQGCARCVCRRRRVPFAELTVGRSALALSDKWGTRVRRATEETMDAVIESGHAFGELGGWAIAPHLRCTTSMFRAAMAMWALVRHLDIHFLCSTATRRHCSASILRKLGGRPFLADGIEIPEYWEPRYGCDMELLRFDRLHDAHSLFEPRIREFQTWLSTVPVICGASRRTGRRDFARFSLQRELDLVAHA